VFDVKTTVRIVMLLSYVVKVYAEMAKAVISSGKLHVCYW
jgi:hypothetical protein